MTPPCACACVRACHQGLAVVQPCGPTLPTPRATKVCRQVHGAAAQRRHGTSVRDARARGRPGDGWRASGSAGARTVATHSCLTLFRTMATLPLDVRQIGRLLDWLDSSGLAANTYVMLGGDNGPALFHNEERPVPKEVCMVDGGKAQWCITACLLRGSCMQADRQAGSARSLRQQCLNACRCACQAACRGRSMKCWRAAFATSWPYVGRACSRAPRTGS